MKSKLLLGLALCIALVGCNKEETVSPGDPQVTMYTSNQTLVEGGEVIELTVELDRDITKPYDFYLDYGSGYGELPNFFDETLQWQGILVNLNDENIRVMAIPFLAGERKKTIRMKAEDNNWYRGDRPIKMRVLSQIEGEAQEHAAVEFGYQDNEPNPVFGIYRNSAEDTERTVRATPTLSELKLTLIADIPFQFPQKIYLNYSGTAEKGVHFEGFDYLEFEGNTVNGRPVINPTVLLVKSSENFEGEKNIRVELVSAEDGGIAKEDVLYDNNGAPFTFGDFFNLIVTAN